MKKALLILAATALAGCETEITVPVKLSQLGTGAMVQATGKTELTACEEIKIIDGEFVKTGKQSDSLLEFRQKLAFIMPGARYRKCEKEGFRDYARFTVPFMLTAGPADREIEDSVVRQDGDQLSVDIPRQSGQDLQAEIDRSFSQADYSDFSVILQIENDTGTDFTGTFHAVRFDDRPVIIGDRQIGAGGTAAVELSALMLEAIVKGEAPFLAITR